MLQEADRGQALGTVEKSAANATWRASEISNAVVYFQVLFWPQIDPRQRNIESAWVRYY